MGVVYRAMDERAQRVVAIEFLRFRLIDRHYRDRLLREAQMAAARDRHPIFSKISAWLEPATEPSRSGRSRSAISRFVR